MEFVKKAIGFLLVLLNVVLRLKPSNEYIPKIIMVLTLLQNNPDLIDAIMALFSQKGFKLDPHVPLVLAREPETVEAVTPALIECLDKAA